MFNDRPTDNQTFRITSTPREALCSENDRISFLLGEEGNFVRECECKCECEA